ncbi:hypothetical protein GUJ93_ZPchr0006g40603 [Zizania palustris]|uniref:Uncharacterized protein n=1 Tax=Zizania palustris TaxID=103762 RepID=A0A8J5SRA1_ZIZPA|nr:hypothetical protein GUJ93_ZPchr0006g40603 [Zizania palustris]
MTGSTRGGGRKRRGCVKRKDDAGVKSGIAEGQTVRLKPKHAETVAMASDVEKDHESDSDADVRKKGSYTGREESDQQKLEIELREKALESLRAKKTTNH